MKIFKVTIVMFSINWYKTINLDNHTDVALEVISVTNQ